MVSGVLEMINFAPVLGVLASCLGSTVTYCNQFTVANPQTKLNQKGLQGLRIQQRSAKIKKQTKVLSIIGSQCFKLYRSGLSEHFEQFVT